jgi:arsenate reductase-like glutaredoxin family protein
MKLYYWYFIPRCESLENTGYFESKTQLEKILENQQVIKTPIVRNRKPSTIGYQPDVWKGWN